MSKNMTTNLRDAPEPVAVYGVSESEPVYCSQVGDSEDFGVVYYCPEASASTVSVSAIQLHESMASKSIEQVKNRKDIITGFMAKDRKTGKEILFSQWTTGLYVYDGGKHYAFRASAFVNMVDDRKKKYNKKDRRGADKALALRQRLGYPTAADLKKMTVQGTYQNIGISTRDVDNMTDIYGTLYADFAGKATHKPTATPSPETVGE